MNIKIKYLKGANKLKKIPNGDWVDLYTYDNVTLKPKEYKAISLGVAMELPPGYTAYVVPRSSTFKKYKLIQANNVGVIDNSYNGNDDIWHFPALNMADETVTIEKGTRLCQFQIFKNNHIEFEEVDNLSKKNRGGFGTTGI